MPEVTPLDPATVTVDSLGPWWDVALAGYAAHDPTVPLDPLVEFVAAQHSDAVSGAMSRPLLAGVRDPASGAPVGFLSGSLPQRENTHLLVLANLVVHPDHRRRGIGSALLAHAARLARADGRSVLSLTAVEPVGSDGSDVAGTRFARAAGAVGTALEVRGTLRLPAGAPQSEPQPQRQPQPERVAAGYELLTWVDATPPELVEQRIALSVAMSTDSPQEQSSLTAEDWDADRVRAVDQRTATTGRTMCTTAARHLASGELVGLTVLAVNRAVPEVAYQWDTIVLAGHRGHRLGLAMKRANLARFVTHSPGTRVIHTWNAGVNRHMIAINDALGFRPTAQDRAFELPLPTNDTV